MDITPLTNSTSSTPEEAASNIQTASVFSINPTADRNMNDQLKPIYENSLKPTEAEPAVHEYMSQSSEHASLAVGDPKNSDVPKLSYVDRQMKYFGDQIGDVSTNAEQTSELAFRKMMSNGNLGDEDTSQLWQLNQDQKAMADRNYDLSGPEKIPAWMAAQIVNQGKSAVRGAYNMLTDTQLPYKGGISGLIGRAALGAFGFRNIVGASYNESDHALKEDGTPLNMDESSKRTQAFGVGVANMAVMGLLPELGEAVLPSLNMITPKFVATAMQAPENAVLKMAVNNIGHAVATMGSMGFAQEATNIVADEMRKNYNGTHSSFLNALVTASEKVATNKDNYAGRLAESTGSGMAMGGLFGLAGNVASRGAMRAQVDAIAGMGQDFLNNVTVTRTGHPIGLIEGEAPPRDYSPSNPIPEPQAPEPRGPMKDVTPIRPNVGDEVPVEQTVKPAVDSLQFHEGLHNVNDVMNTTKMNDLAPQESTSFMKKVFDRAGISKLYMTMSGARQFAVDPAAAVQMGNITDIASAHMNAPMAVSPEEVMRIARTNPEILDHVSSSPEAPSPLQAKTHLDNMQAAVEKRVQILTSLGIKPEDVVPESSNVTQLPQKEATPFDLDTAVKRTQEIVDQKRDIDEARVSPTATPEDGTASLTDARSRQFKNMSSNSLQVIAGYDGPGVKPEEIEGAKAELDSRKEQHSKLDKELETIKDQVQNHFKMNQAPGKLVFGHWPEPDIEGSNAALASHINLPTFSDAIKSALPEADVTKIEGANTRAKQDRVEGIKEAAKHEMNKVQDINVEESKDIRRQEEVDRIANDPNYKIVDQVRSSIEFTKAQDKKAVSPFQIDPKTLSTEQLKYIDHFRMKEHKIFAKGGTTANASAQLLGLNNGDELLHVLARTPTREQVARARAAANATFDEQSIRSQDDLNHVKIIEEIRNQAKNHLEWMKFMKDQEWPALKKAIKKIALPLPRIDELELRAQQAVSKMKIGDLNARQYEVGENRSNRLAINSLLKGDIETAFQAKEQAALNSLMRKEVMIQTAKANRTMTFARRMNRPANQQLLRDAGPIFQNAMEELTSLWNLNPRAPKQLPEGLQGSFQKWAAKELKEGRGDFTFPEALSDLRQNVKDMTVNQLMVVGDRMRVILNEAKMQNKFIRHEAVSERAEHAEDMDRIEAKARFLLQNHPAYNIKRVRPPGGNFDLGQKVMMGFQNAEQLIAGKQNIYRELDKGSVGGFFQTTFDHQMEGAGEYHQKMGFTLLRELERQDRAKIEALKKVHGGIDDIEKKFIYIPEFSEVKELNYGRNFTKGDLMRAYAFRAQEYTKDLLTSNNGGVADATWQTVLDREIETKDVEFIHGVGDLYKDYQPRIKELQESEGRDVDFIQGNPITHRGVTRDGFYNRAQYEHEYTEAAAKDAKDFLEKANAAYFEKKEGDKWGRQFGAETTHQGYLVSRKGNDEPLSLNFGGLFSGLAEIRHDVSYRTPLKNFFELTSRKELLKDMIATVGEPKVETLIQTNLEIAGRPSAKDEGYFTNPNRFIKSALSRLGNNYAISALWGKSSVVIKQWEASTEMFNALGPKAIYHAIAVNGQMLANLDKMEGYIAFAKRLDPSISKYFDDVQDNSVSFVGDLIPKKSSSPAIKESLGKGGNALVKTGDALHAFQEMATTAGFFPVTASDAYLKTLQAFTTWKHVLNGDHADFPQERWASMSDEDKFNAVQGVIQQMSTLTQIQNRNDLKAPIQKHMVGKLFTPFWNYPRNILNNTLLDARRTKWKSQEGWDKASQGDYAGAAGSFKSAGSIMLSRMIWSTIGLTLTGYATGKAYQLTKKSINSVDDLLDAGMEMVGHIMQSPVQQAIETSPVENVVNYAIEHKKKYARADVQIPVTQALSSIATCVGAAEDLMELGRMPSKMRIRACLEAESYVYVPLPVGGGYAAMKWLNQSSTPSSGLLSMNGLQGAVDKMKGFVDDHPKDVDPKFVDSVKNMHDQLAPEVAEVPKGTADSIKGAMSGGDWASPNGLYGFSKNQWAQIQKGAPELGLTESGRTSKNTAQQEKAIDWSLNQSAHQLAEKEIPVNKNTLFGVHKLGMDDYEKLYRAPGDAKLKTVLGSSAIEKNPDLVDFKTVGQVKAHLTKTLSEGKPLPTTANLTKPTPNAED